MLYTQFLNVLDVVEKHEPKQKVNYFYGLNPQPIITQYHKEEAEKITSQKMDKASSLFDMFI